MRLAARALAVTAVALLASACVFVERHHRVGSREFQALAGLPLGSMRHSTFLGSNGVRAYLTLWTAGPFGGEDIYSCELDSLPAGIAARIRAGENPWPK
jgi:hypothetical protein